MFGLPILDVAIGISFFYLVFALICTTVNETLSRWFKKRPKVLEEAICSLLNEDWKNKVLGNALIKGLSRPGKQDQREKPSYIDAKDFATALLDELTGLQPVTDTAELEKGLNTLPENAQKALKTLYEKVDGRWDVFHKEIEDWYNSAMDRAEGWYKRYVQKQTKVLALVIVLWANFDTLQVAHRLWSDSALRASVVEAAKERAKARAEGNEALAVYDAENPGKGTAVDTNEGQPLSAAEESLISSVTGWQRDLADLAAQQKRDPAKYSKTQWLIMHIFGWGISVFAISLGAPFWFDTLNRFVNIRNAGRAPDEPRSKNVSVKKDADQ